MNRLRSSGTAALVVGLVLAGCSQGTSKPKDEPLTDEQILALKPAGTNAVIVHAIGYGTGTIAISDPSQTCVSYDWEDSAHYSQVCWAFVPIATTSVTVMAAPTSGARFTGWTGPCAGSADGACAVPMDRDRIMNVGFAPGGATGTKSEYVLSVRVLGFIDGEISAPAGVGLVCQPDERTNYARTCMALVPSTTPPAQVTLTATPTEAGTQFAGWGGSCTGTGTCTVTMDRDVSVNAAFVMGGSGGGSGTGGTPATGPSGCGDLAETGILQSWSYVFTPGAGVTTTLSAPSAPAPYRGQSFVRAVTTAAFDFGLVYTAPAPIDARGFEQLRFAVRALNPNLLVNGSPWQGAYPLVWLQDSHGSRQLYAPTTNLMPRDGTTWVPVTVPVGGGSGWTVTGTVDLASITRIEIHADTWEWNALTIDVDALSFDHPLTTCTAGAPPAIQSFSASPATIQGGQSTTLSWNVTNAGTISIDQGVGAVSGTSVAVSPAATTTYTITAANAYGTTTATATVTVQEAAGPWREVAAGVAHTVAIRSDGTLWAWGVNNSGQLGDGTTTQRNSPKQIGTGFATVAAGLSHTVAVKTDGTLWAWGANYDGEVGDGTRTMRPAPVQIGTGFASVAAGWGFTIAVKTDGTLWACGGNDRGQLGDGGGGLRTSLFQVGNGFVSVAAGQSHTMALKQDDTLWAWGANDRGQLGDGTTIQRNWPVQIGTGFAVVAAGPEHTVAVRRDGSLWAWGVNAFGALGDGTTIQRSSPVQIGTGFAAVAAGDYHAVAVQADGTLFAWGWNANGQLGDGTTTIRYSPVIVGSGFRSVAAGGNHSAAVRTEGTLWSWGDNLHGQVGDGTTVDRLTPGNIGAMIPALVTTIDAISNPGSPVNVTTQAFSFSSSIAGVTFQCSMDASVFAPCSPPQTYSGLIDGVHTFRVFASDNGLDEAVPQEYTWVVDTRSPRVIVISITVSPTSAVIDWGTDEPTTSAMIWGPGSNRDQSIVDDGVLTLQHSVELQGLLPDTIYSFVLQGHDAAGNMPMSTIRGFLTAPAP